MREEAQETDSARLGLPSELREPPPRKVQINSTDGRLGLIVGALLLGVGITALGFLSISAYRQLQERTALRNSGHDATGIVTNTRGGHGNSSVSYTFTANGATYGGRAELPDYPLNFHESERIVIRYIPSNPNLNHPTAWEWSDGTNIIPQIFMLFFAVMGGVALNAVFRDRKLARLGKVAEGVVTKCAHNRRRFRIEYQFRTEDSGPTAGSCDCANKYEEGGRIWVLYMPDKPQRNHCYPLAFYSIDYK